MAVETEYRIDFKLLRSRSSQNRVVFTWAWGRTEAEAIAKIRNHHGRIEVLSIRAERTAQR